MIRKTQEDPKFLNAVEIYILIREDGCLMEFGTICVSQILKVDSIRFLTVFFKELHFYF